MNVGQMLKVACIVLNGENAPGILVRDDMEQEIINARGKIVFLLGKGPEGMIAHFTAHFIVIKIKFYG